MPTCVTVTSNVADMSQPCVENEAINLSTSSSPVDSAAIGSNASGTSLPSAAKSQGAGAGTPFSLKRPVKTSDIAGAFLCSLFRSVGD